jgi:shikimate dehydrogenase
MFLNQAILQFELWTNQPAPADVMRAVLESRFQ